MAEVVSFCSKLEDLTKCLPSLFRQLLKTFKISNSNLMSGSLFCSLARFKNSSADFMSVCSFASSFKKCTHNVFMAKAVSFCSKPKNSPRCLLSLFSQFLENFKILLSKQHVLLSALNFWESFQNYSCRRHVCPFSLHFDLRTAQNMN